MLQRTNKLLIGKDINRDAQVVAGALITTTVGSTGLADGEVVVLDKYFKVLAAGATIVDSDIIYICQGTGETYDYVNEAGTTVSTNRRLILSDPIEGAKVRSYIGKSYVAKSEQVTTITPATPVLGTEYLVKITYKDMPEHPGKFTQTYRVIATGTNADTNLCALFRAKINEHKGARVVASGSTTLILTGKPIPACTTSVNDIEEFRMVEFDVVYNKVTTTGWVNDDTSITTTAASYGSGTWEQVRDYEKFAMPYMGIKNFTNFPVIKPDMRTVKSATYDLIAIEHDKSYVSPDNQYVKQAPITTTIAFVVPSSGTQETDVLAALNPWMASCPGAFAAVTV